MLSFSVNSFAANFGWTLIFLPTTACEGSYDGWCALSSHVGMASAFNFCARKLAIWCLGVWPRSSVSVAEGAYKVTLSDWTLFYTALLWSLHDNACVAGIRVFEKLDFMIQEENTCWPSSRVAKVRSRISKLSDIMFIYIYIYIITSPVWPIWPFKKVGTLQTTFFQGTLFAKYFLMKRRFQNSTFLFFTHLSLFLLLLHQPWRWEVFHPPEESMSIDCPWMKRIVSFVRNFYQSSRSMKCWYKGWYRWMIWHQEEGWVHFGLFEQDNYWNIFNFLCLEQAKSFIVSRNLMFKRRLIVSSCFQKLLKTGTPVMVKCQPLMNFHLRRSRCKPRLGRFGMYETMGLGVCMKRWKGT